MNMMLPNYVALFENAPYPQGIGNSLGKLMSFFGFSVTCKAKPMGKKLWFFWGVLGRIRLLNGDQIHQSKILATFFGRLLAKRFSLPMSSTKPGVRDPSAEGPASTNAPLATMATRWPRNPPVSWVLRIGPPIPRSFALRHGKYLGPGKWGDLEKNHKNRGFNMI